MGNPHSAILILTLNKFCELAHILSLKLPIYTLIRSSLCYLSPLPLRYSVSSMDPSDVSWVTCSNSCMTYKVTNWTITSNPHQCTLHLLMCHTTPSIAWTTRSPGNRGHNDQGGTHLRLRFSLFWQSLRYSCTACMFLFGSTALGVCGFPILAQRLNSLTTQTRAAAAQFQRRK